MQIVNSQYRLALHPYVCIVPLITVSMYANYVCLAHAPGLEKRNDPTDQEFKMCYLCYLIA